MPTKKFVEEKRKLGKCPRKNNLSSSLFLLWVNVMEGGDLHGSLCDMELYIMLSVACLSR